MKYTIKESEARVEINTIYRDPQAWDKGVRSYNNGVPGCVTAGAYIKSPRGEKYGFIAYGNDETYKLKSAAAQLGAKGRAVNSEAQRKAAAENGKKGGRPKKVAPRRALVDVPQLSR
jgi:hypothetical protein